MRQRSDTKVMRNAEMRLMKAQGFRVSDIARKYGITRQAAHMITQDVEYPSWVKP